MSHELIDVEKEYVDIVEVSELLAQLDEAVLGAPPAAVAVVIVDEVPFDVICC